MVAREWQGKPALVVCGALRLLALLQFGFAGCAASPSGCHEGVTRARVEAWLMRKPDLGVYIGQLDCFLERDAWVEEGKKIPRLEECLVQMVEGESYASNRAALVAALGDVGTRLSTPTLTRALSNKSEESIVRMHAASSLGCVGDPGALDVLIQGLEDPDPDVRSVVCVWLGQYSDPRARAALRTALGDRDITVRKSAAGAISASRTRRARVP